MIALVHGFAGVRSALALCLVAALQGVLLPPSARAINILIDYRYDTNNFFNTQQRRDTLQAAADRYSAIITSSLAAVNLVDDGIDPRIGFTHPALGGGTFRVSPAASSLTDAVVNLLGQPHANEYRSWSVAADQWILFAGGRDMATQGVGGQIAVTNLSTVNSSSGSIVNRNFRTSGSNMNMPVWGGSIAFDTVGTAWHDDHLTSPAPRTVDLYSVALHEIGHALGLNRTWNEWTSHLTGQQFSGEAVTAYNTDNGAASTTLNIASGAPSLDPHWQDNAYDSFIFQNAGPNLVGTVGVLSLQDLLMEMPHATGWRYELTNVDVAALRDVGWDTVPQLLAQTGDFNRNGAVDASDSLAITKGLTNGAYATWRANFAESLPPTSPAAGASHVPEPPLITVLAAAVPLLLLTNGRRFRPGALLNRRAQSKFMGGTP